MVSSGARHSGSCAPNSAGGKSAAIDAAPAHRSPGPAERADASNAEATLAVGEISEEPKFLLATLPPTSGQRRLALAVVAALLVALGITVPFASVPLPRVDAFIPSLLGVFCVNDFITAVLLFSQFSIGRSRALLVLASGYLFAALMAIPQALTFPGAFSPTGLLGAGLHSAAWLYFFWHFGFPSALLLYSWLKNEQHSNQASPRSAIGWGVAIVISLVGGFTWLATAGEELLPPLFIDVTRMTPWVFRMGVLNTLFIALVLALLWMRARSLLDQWLMVVALALFGEAMLVTVFETSRFSLGFYAGRIFSIVTSLVVLAVLIAETTKLDARLARSNMMLQRERNNKMMTLAAMAATISHEVRQPLMSIAMNGGAALQFLGHTPPDVGEARSALDTILNDSLRASQIFDSIGGLFKGGDQRQEPVDVNEIALGALRILRPDLKEHDIATRSELTTGLPPVIGHRGQLQEVVLNLVNNAIEAMDSIKDEPRVLRVRTERPGPDEIAVTIEDSGPGLDPTKLAHVFDAFVTSKPQGMGLGLSICQMIIERHGGQLSARSGEKGGALFQFTLPIKSPMGLTNRPIL
jgi:signal transduction histidine kinase